MKTFVIVVFVAAVSWLVLLTIGMLVVIINTAAKYFAEKKLKKIQEENEDFLQRLHLVEEENAELRKRFRFIEKAKEIKSSVLKSQETEGDELKEGEENERRHKDSGCMVYGEQS